MTTIKDILIRPAKGMGTVYEVYFKGGGEVPAFLKQLYTRRSFAQNAITDYLSTREPKKGENNVKKSSKRGSDSLQSGSNH